MSGTASHRWKRIGVLLAAGASAGMPAARVAAQADVGPRDGCSEARRARPATRPAGPSDGGVFLSGDGDDISHAAGPTRSTTRSGLVARGACGPSAAQPSLAAIRHFGVAPGLPPVALDLVDRARPNAASPGEPGEAATQKEGALAGDSGSGWLRASSDGQPVPLRWGLWQGAALLALEDGAAQPHGPVAPRASRAASDQGTANHRPRATAPEPPSATGEPAEGGAVAPSNGEATGAPADADAEARRFMALARAHAGASTTPAPSAGSEPLSPETSGVRTDARPLPDGPSDRKVAEAVAHRRSAFQRCYAMSVQGLSRPPRVAYEVRLGLTAQGDVDQVRLAARRGDVPGLARCVRTVAEDLDLAGRYAEPTTIRFPVVFAPGN